MARGQREVVVRRQQLQVVADAKLREQRVDRADLNASASALITQVSCADVVFAIRDDKRQRSKPLDDVSVRAGPVEALQKLLQNEPGGHHEFGATERIAECHDFGRA
jgi:hypothetical protein